MKQAGRKYIVEFELAMAGYTVLLFASIAIVKRIGPSPLAYALMLLPLIPILYGMTAMARFFASMDELQQRIQLMAFTFAFGGAAMITFAYGLLETAGAPRLSWVWIFPLMMVLWGIGNALAWAKYK